MSKIKDIIIEEVSTPAVGYFWKGFALFLLGVIIGFSIAPVKNGMQILSGNVITNTECGECDKDEEEEE